MCVPRLVTLICVREWLVIKSFELSKWWNDCVCMKTFTNIYTNYRLHCHILRLKVHDKLDRIVATTYFESYQTSEFKQIWNYPNMFPSLSVDFVRIEYDWYMFSVIEASNIIQGIQFNTQIPRGSGQNQEYLTALRDNDKSTCMAPIQDTAWLTVSTAFPHISTHVVMMVVPNATKCTSPEITVIAETTTLDVMLECMLLQVTPDPASGDLNVCEYKCYCGGCCAYIHVHVQNVQYRDLSVVNWQLCHIDVCIENWFSRTTCFKVVSITGMASVI